MKVVILCTSDSNGGAAIVSHRLMSILNQKGIEANMLVADKRTDDSRITAVTAGRKVAFYLERLKIFLANGLNRKDLFKVSTASDGVDILNNELIKNADIICLNWINQGFLSLRELDALCRSGKKIVWTMHDMWCCTGICHHAYSCKNYLQACGNCMFMRFPAANDLSNKVWRKKREIIKASSITFVAVSSWLAERCRRSGLLNDQKIEVIANALPMKKFAYQRTGRTDKKVVIMGAARLDEHVKGFELMVEAADYIADNYPDDARNIELKLFGNIRDTDLLKQIRLPYEYLGAVKPEKVPELYRSADIVLSSSHFETLPTTLIEGQASGCIPVAFHHGGQPDIVTHKVNGYLAKYPDTTDLGEGILWAAKQHFSREELHNDVTKKFDESAIAEKHIELFKSL